MIILMKETSKMPSPVALTFNQLCIKFHYDNTSKESWRERV